MVIALEASPGGRRAQRRLAALLVLLVALPLGLLAWLGVRVVRHERDATRHRFRAMLESKLADADALVVRLIEDRERTLLRLTDLDPPTPEALRALVANHGAIRQAFWLDPEGRLRFPATDAEMSAQERAFLTRTRGVWEEGRIFYRAASEWNQGPPQPDSTASAQQPLAQAASAQAESRQAASAQAESPIADEADGAANAEGDMLSWGAPDSAGQADPAALRSGQSDQSGQSGRSGRSGSAPRANDRGPARQSSELALRQEAGGPPPPITSQAPVPPMARARPQGRSVSEGANYYEIQTGQQQRLYVRRAVPNAPPQGTRSPPDRPADEAPRVQSRQSYRRSAPVRPEGPRPAALPLEGHGWYVWYVEGGIDLLFWRRDGAGRILGVELDRVRLLADIVAELPDSVAGDPLLAKGGIRLLDEQGRPVYQWGAVGDDPLAPGPLAAFRQLSPPLGAWRLEYRGPAMPEGMGESTGFLLGAGLFAVGLALGGLALYLYRETTRQWREATQRVSFVNQVSHELKTPLTNIRMYAELLAGRLEEEDQEARHRLGVVLAESERLGRLVNNVLSFARAQRGTIRLRPTPVVPDAVIDEVLESFRPSLTAKGVVIERDARAATPLTVDREVLVQVLTNLISNVEKYAAGGGWVSIRSAVLPGSRPMETAFAIHEARPDEAPAAGGHGTSDSAGAESRASTESVERKGAPQTLTVLVADRGPGIPPDKRQAIFNPFTRLDDRLNEGVSGTGIGLSIARDLARLHGGDLSLVTTYTRGSAFAFSLAAPPPVRA